MFRLVGDEDTGVGLHCRTCDRGGLPVAYVCPEGVANPYRHEGDVVMVHGVLSMVEAGREHGRVVHGLHVWLE